MTNFSVIVVNFYNMGHKKYYDVMRFILIEILSLLKLMEELQEALYRKSNNTKYCMHWVVVAKIA